MNRNCLHVLAASCLVGLAAGCQQRNENGESQNPAATLQADSNNGSGNESALDTGSEAAIGWKTYEAADGSFTVFAPGQPPDVSTEKLPVWKEQRYAFKDGNVSFVIEIYSGRKGAVATNTVDDLRDSPDIVAGTLRDVTLSGMPGIEFRTQGNVGEVVHREYCSTDNSKSISIFVQKDLVTGMSEGRIQQFLDSFKLKD